MKRFEVLVLAIGVLGITPRAGAVNFPILCGDQSTAHQININAGAKTAKVSRHQKPTRFGDLSCTRPLADNNAILRCRSLNVADAGFQLILEKTSGDLVQAKLSEVWFGGVRPLETLKCRDEAVPNPVRETEGDVLLKCEDPNSRGLGYLIKKKNHEYSLVRMEAEREVQTIVLSGNDPFEAIDGYGGTYLYALDAGRSGYLLIYSHQARTGKRESLIDINLFPEAAQSMNTGGPQRDFVCERPSP